MYRDQAISGELASGTPLGALVMCSLKGSVTTITELPFLLRSYWGRGLTEYQRCSA